MNPNSLEQFQYLRAIQGHSGGTHIDPTLQDNVLLPDDFAEQAHLSRWELSRLTLYHPVWIDSAWEDSQER